MSQLRVFYDGQCPLCLTEINHLRRLNKAAALDLQDINANDFGQRFPHINVVAADRILHGERADGTLIYGLDVTCEAWQLVGKGHWFSFLRWPVFRPIADLGYRFFARHRHRISALIGRRTACDDSCQ